MEQRGSYRLLMLCSARFILRKLAMQSLGSGLTKGRSPFGARRGAFTPASLFRNGEVGLWDDPSDITTLFQDAAGTTAVAAAADPTGLVLDKSKGLVQGSELVANGDFASDTTGWTINGATRGTAVSSGGRVVITNNYALGSSTGFTGIIQGITTVIGKSYRYAVNCAGTAGMSVTNVSNGSGSYAQTTGTGNKQLIFTATATTTYFVIYVNSSADAATANFDDVTLKELPGNHAVLSGANTLRPLYQITPKRLLFDGSDDRLLTALNPTASGSIAMRLRGTTASRVALGSQGASNGRAFLALAADGSLAAGIGADSTTTIKGSTDIRNAWATGVVTWDGATVNLYQDGVSVYSGAQNGAVNTTVPWMLGCLNNNATAASFWAGDIGAAVVLNRVLTPSEAISLTNSWSTIQ